MSNRSVPANPCTTTKIRINLSLRQVIANSLPAGQRPLQPAEGGARSIRRNRLRLGARLHCAGK